MKNNVGIPPAALYSLPESAAESELNAPRYINNMNSFRQFRLKLEKHQKTAATLKIVIF